MSVIRYENIPVSMPRNNFAGKKFIAPANSVSISHSAKVSAYRTLAPNTLPDMRVGGNTDTKITIAFPLCNKFANND